MAGRFLMITSREQEVLAQSERQALLRFSGLRPEELEWVRLDWEPFPTLDLAEWDGIILCGSRFDASAKEADKPPLQREVESALYDLYGEILRKDFPYLGLCYGMGTMTTYLGGTVDSRYTEEISAPTLTLTAEGQKDPLLRGVSPRFQAYVGHHEAVSKLAPGMTLLVSGEVAPVQMVRLRNNVYATQFHPELDLEGINLRIDIFADAGYYSPENRPLVEARVQGVDTTDAHRVLRNFAQIYSGHRFRF